MHYTAVFIFIFATLYVLFLQTPDIHIPFSRRISLVTLPSVLSVSISNTNSPKAGNQLYSAARYLRPLARGQRTFDFVRCSKGVRALARFLNFECTCCLFCANKYVIMFSFFQLSELEQRVLEAEGRAEEAEDKVSVKSDAFNFGGWGSSSLLCNALAFIAFIDYFPSRRECPWTWRLSADRTTRNWYSFLFGILLFFMLFCWWAVFSLLNCGINSWENVSCTHEFYNTTHRLLVVFFLIFIFLSFSRCALSQSLPASRF